MPSVDLLQIDPTGVEGLASAGPNAERESLPDPDQRGGHNTLHVTVLREGDGQPEAQATVFYLDDRASSIEELARDKIEVSRREGRRFDVLQDYGRSITTDDRGQGSIKWGGGRVLVAARGSDGSYAEALVPASGPDAIRLLLSRRDVLKIRARRVSDGAAGVDIPLAFVWRMREATSLGPPKAAEWQRSTLGTTDATGMLTYYGARTLRAAILECGGEPTGFVLPDIPGIGPVAKWPQVSLGAQAESLDVLVPSLGSLTIRFLPRLPDDAKSRGFVRLHTPGSSSATHLRWSRKIDESQARFPFVVVRRAFAVHPSNPYACTSRTAIGPSAPGEDADFVLESGGLPVRFLRSREGAPLAPLRRARIQCRLSEGDKTSWTSAVTTDRTGLARIPQPTKEGESQAERLLGCWHDGLYGIAPIPAFRAPSSTITVVLRQQGVYARGSVWSDTGDSLDADVFALLQPDSQAGASVGITVTGNQFVVHASQALARLGLRIEREGYVSKALSLVRSRSRERRITLERANSLEVKLRLPSEVPPSAIAMWVERQDGATPRGSRGRRMGIAPEGETRTTTLRYAWSSLPAGSYSVYCGCTSPPYTLASLGPIDIPHSENRVAFDLRSAVYACVLKLKAKGLPISGISAFLVVDALDRPSTKPLGACALTPGKRLWMPRDRTLRTWILAEGAGLTEYAFRPKAPGRVHEATLELRTRHRFEFCPSLSLGNDLRVSALRMSPLPHAQAPSRLIRLWRSSQQREPRYTTLRLASLYGWRPQVLGKSLELPAPFACEVSARIRGAWYRAPTLRPTRMARNPTTVLVPKR